MLKLNMVQLVVIEGQLESNFNQNFVENVVVKSKKDRQCLPHQRLCYIHLKTKEWNEKVENKIFQVFLKQFKIELAFWTNHRTLSQAEKTLKRTQGVALLVEHPNQKREGVYLTTYLVTPRLKKSHKTIRGG